MPMIRYIIVRSEFCVFSPHTNLEDAWRVQGMIKLASGYMDQGEWGGRDVR